MSGTDTHPLISIIITTFNQESFVEECLRSALGQDYENKEIVVVDNNSSDGTLDLIRQFGTAVRLFTEPSPGPAAARNRGIRESRGEYISFLDGDDVWLPGKLSAQVAAMRRRPEAGLCCSRFMLWHCGRDGRYPRPPSVDAEPGGAGGERYVGSVFPELLLSTTVWTSTVLIPHRVANEVGEFDESLAAAEDLDYWCRIAVRYPIVFLDRPTALYRQHPRSVMHTFRRDNPRATVMERWRSRVDRREDAELRKEVDRTLGVVWWRHANRAVRAGDRDTACRALDLALRYGAPTRRARSYRWLALTPWSFMALTLFSRAKDHVSGGMRTPAAFEVVPARLPRRLERFE